MSSELFEVAESLWRGELDLIREYHPVEKKFPAGHRLTERVLWYKGTASATTIDTGDGLVMLDTGSRRDTNILYSEIRKWTSAPLRMAVFSHHHLDHIFGTRPFEIEAEDRGWSPPVVYGHELMAENFNRYRRTPGFQGAINSRQFIGLRDPADFDWPTEYRYPDITYRDQLSFQQGDLTFELNHARGETEDHTWTWVPELGILHPGDLFIWALPNAGSAQKVQRYPGEWAAALRQMAGKNAETFLPGHGVPIFGRERIQQALSDTAELLEFLEVTTISLMNDGLSLDAILEQVTVPQHLADKPYLKIAYDHPDFIVRNVWRLFGGWYEGEPDRLLPAPRRLEAEQWIDLAGGTGKVEERIEQLVDSQDYRLACHLVEALAIANPESQEIHQLRARVYRLRSEPETSAIARHILLHAAHSSEAGRRDLALNEE